MNFAELIHVMEAKIVVVGGISRTPVGPNSKWSEFDKLSDYR